MSSDKLTPSEQILIAVDLLDSLRLQLTADTTIPASQSLSASIDIGWAITRLNRARGHLESTTTEGPGYDA